MATGTEGPDVLTNDQTLSSETIDALGGDDTIIVSNPHPPGPETNLSSVTVNGGAGVDTLRISAPFITSLSANSAFVHDGTSGASIFVFRYPANISWSGIERLVISGSGYFGRAQNGSFLPGQWSTGDTADEIHVVSTRGQARITVSSGGGDDEVHLGDVGFGSQVFAGAGDDLVDMAGFRSFLGAAFGEDGNDTLLGSPQADTLQGGAGDDFLDGRGDSDTASYGGAPAPVVVSLSVAGPQDTGGAGIDMLVSIENLTGSAFADTLTGNAFANTLDGGLGGDLLKLNDGGSDTALGGDGNDVLYFGAAFDSGDLARGGPGRDAVVLQGNYATTLSATNLAEVESLSLQSGANARWGDTANNSYDYDIATVDANVAPGQVLIVNGQSLRVGEDLIFDGSAETDGRFEIYGGDGADRITGGSGGDSIYGGGGADVLAGGPGDDLFVHSMVAHSPAVGRDRILDFAAGDRIDLSAIDADPATAANDAFIFIGGATFSGRPGELRVSSGGSGWIVEADLDGDGIGDFGLVVLTTDGHLATSSDFVL